MTKHTCRRWLKTTFIKRQDCYLCFTCAAGWWLLPCVSAECCARIQTDTFVANNTTTLHIMETILREPITPCNQTITQLKPVTSISHTTTQNHTHQPVCLDTHSCQYLHSVTAARQEFPPENSSSLSRHATHCVVYDPNNHYNHEKMLLYSVHCDTVMAWMCLHERWQALMYMPC